MASDLISRGDVLELLYRLKEDRGCPKNYGTLLTIISRTWELPTVDAVEVVHGEWITKCMEGSWTHYRYSCSNCGSGFDSNSNYCPNCGADMRGKKNASD